MPLYRAREELMEKGYIIYEKGKGREAGTYTIIKIELYKKTEEGDYNLFPNMGNEGKHNEVLCNSLNNSLNNGLCNSLCNSSHPNMGTLNKQIQNNKKTKKEKKIYIKKEIPNDFLKELEENEKGISEDRIREAYLGNVSGLSEAEMSKEISKEIKLEKPEEWTKEADKDKYEAGSVININDASPKDINDISMLNDDLDRINRVNRVRELEKENEFGMNEYDDMNMLATNTPITNETKVKYGDSIYLTDQEYRTLKSIYEQNDIDLGLGIEILDDYKMSSGREYRSDYHIMKSWVKKRLLEDKRKALMNENYTGYKATRSVPSYQQNNSNNYNQNNNNNSYNQYNQHQGIRKQRSWEDFKSTLPEEWLELIDEYN